jgi:hypothetical protein
VDECASFTVSVYYNDVWNNVSGDYKDTESLTGINGNISMT